MIDRERYHNKFDRWCIATKHSNTAEQYSRTVQRFFDMFPERDLSRLDETHVLDYVWKRMREEPTRSIDTVRKELSALSALWRFLQETDFPECPNPVLRINQLKVLEALVGRSRRGSSHPESRRAPAFPPQKDQAPANPNNT